MLEVPKQAIICDVITASAAVNRQYRAAWWWQNITAPWWQNGNGNVITWPSNGVVTVTYR